MTDDEMATQIAEKILAKSAAIRSVIQAATSPWLTADEVAERLKISPRKVKELRESGKLRGGLVPGMEQFRYHRDDVDRCVVMPRRIG